mgnify:FL=1
MKINKFIYVLTMIILVFSITSCNNSSNSSSDSSSEIINTSEEEFTGTILTNDNEDIKRIMLSNNQDTTLGTALPVGIKFELENPSAVDMYIVSLNKDYYLVCGYIEEKYLNMQFEDSNLPSGYGYQDGYYEKVTWVKYNNESKILNKYNNLVVSQVYLIFDMKILVNLQTRQHDYENTIKLYCLYYSSNNNTFSGINKKYLEEKTLVEYGCKYITWNYDDDISNKQYIYGKMPIW